MGLFLFSIIVVDTLQSSLAKEKLDGHLLSVKPLGPSFSVLISSKEKLDAFIVKFFCKRYCNDGTPEVSQKPDNKFVVTFSSQQGTIIILRVLLNN